MEIVSFLVDLFFYRISIHAMSTVEQNQDDSNQDLSLEQRIARRLDIARQEHFQADVPWAYRDENCTEDNHAVLEYKDGRKLLVEILPGRQERVVKEL